MEVAEELKNVVEWCWCIYIVGYMGQKKGK